MMWDAVPEGERFHYNVQYKQYTLFNITLTYPPPPSWYFGSLCLNVSMGYHFINVWKTLIQDRVDRPSCNIHERHIITHVLRRYIL